MSETESGQNKRYFYGKRNEVLPEIVAFLNMRLELEEKDIGAWVGDSWEVKMKQRFRPLTIDFHLNKEPKSPFANQGTGRRVAIKVPFIAKSKITYDSVRKALAPASWGKYSCSLHFESPQGVEGHIKAPGSSESDAVKVVENLFEFVESGSRIVSVRPFEKRPEGIYKQGSILQLTSHKLYPHRMCISNQDLVEAEKRKGKRLVKPTIVPLWYDTAPEWVKFRIKEGLKKGDDDV